MPIPKGIFSGQVMIENTTYVNSYYGNYNTPRPGDIAAS